MKYLIAGDIHGSYYAAKRLVEAIRKENADHLILLGDIYNHGPRNPLPKEYAPMLVAEILNAVSDITVIKGNCDSEVDQMISSFTFTESAYIFVDGLKIFLTHGHKFNEDAVPEGCRIMFFGHTHIGRITEKNGVVFANPGSVSLPKNNSEEGYLFLDGRRLQLKNLDGKILDERSL